MVESYLEIGRLARSAKRALLSCAWDDFADLMNRNHALVRDLGGSGESNERLIAAALTSGAQAAKLAGAGGGGTILVLTHDPARTTDALLAAGADRILTPQPVSAGLTVEIQI